MKPSIVYGLLIAQCLAIGAIGFKVWHPSADKDAEETSEVLTGISLEHLAAHEAGHAVVVWANRDVLSVGTVTTLSSKGKEDALGRCEFSSVKWQGGPKPRSVRLKEAAVYYGGRAAEDIVYSEPFTGAWCDIEHATEIVEIMYKSEAMGKAFGMRADTDSKIAYSDETHRAYDTEVRETLGVVYADAKATIEKYRAGFDALRATLVHHRTLTGLQAGEIIATGIPLPPPPAKDAGE